MDIRNTPYNVTAIAPVSHDQVQACWRYLLQGEATYAAYVTGAPAGHYNANNLPMSVLSITAIAANHFKTLATAIHNGHVENLDKFTARGGIDYSTWHQNYPGFDVESSNEYMFFKREYPHVFHQQLQWECTRWSLNVNIMKGCLLGYAVEKMDCRDALVQKKLREFMGYSGAIHLLSKVANDVVTKPALTIALGKKGRRGGFKKKGKGKKGKRGKRSKKSYRKSNRTRRKLHN